MFEDKKQQRYLHHCYSGKGLKGTIENWTYISLFKLKNLINQVINTQENLKNVNANQCTKVYEALLCLFNIFRLSCLLGHTV